MAIALADILDQRQVALLLRSRRRPSAIREIVRLFEKTGSVARPAGFLAQVLAREEAGSALAENGVALPHARTELVDQITLAIGRSHAGIPWNDQGKRARLIFLFGRSATTGEQRSRPHRNFGPRHTRPTTARCSVCRRNSGGIYRNPARSRVILIPSTNDRAHDRGFAAHWE